MKRIEDPVLLVVFGASGDLSKRKLIPALYRLAYQNLLPPSFTLLGYARTEYSDEEFRELACEGIKEHSDIGFDEHIWRGFSQGLFYQTGKYDDKAGFEALAKRVTELDQQRNTGGNHVYYLATPPSVFKPIATLL